jgi:adenylate cyclase
MFKRHGRRMAITLLPMVLAVLYALGVLPMGALQSLDDSLYDARLRATLTATHDPRIVIVDIDEKSLAEVGRWPWSRHRVAELVDRLFEEHRIALLGFDTVFAEPDTSSGLPQLRQLAQGPLAGQRGFAESLTRLQTELDYDARLARAIRGRPVVLGYYFTSDRQGRRSGQLPAPVMEGAGLMPLWSGYGANIEALAQATPHAGFFNAIASPDGVVRTLPLLAVHQGQVYESLSLAMFRLLNGSPQLQPGYERHGAADGYQTLTRLILQGEDLSISLPLDERLSMLVPFKGPGGPQGGTFTYLSAADILAGRVPTGALHDKIVLVGTTAPGLQDLRTTPVGGVYPGVETQANLLASLMDGRQLVRPDYAPGYEMLVLVVTGLLLAVWLPVLNAARAAALSVSVLAAVIGLNTWLYLVHGLVLPLASALVMTVLVSTFNLGYGYWVEGRAKRQLARLFGSYVPPELVRQMLRQPERYSMAASTRELTVMFSDMRSFTRLAEAMEPTHLQALLHTVFSRLTEVIRRHSGTIDKYMGDCVMAFWGAPIDNPAHASQAVQAALDMVQVVQRINQERGRDGLPAIQLGIGLSTGPMCVGDIGSDVRRSYTVVGDAVNLGARLEGLCSVYGVDVIASDNTRRQATEFVWQELDRVRVRGKAEAVTIHYPLCHRQALSERQMEELQQWETVLQAWRSQDWERCERSLVQLQREHETKVLYGLYAKRVALMRQSPPAPDWDGTTDVESK